MNSKTSRNCLEPSKSRQFTFIALYGILAGIITMMVIIWLWIAYWYIGLIVVSGFVVFWIVFSYMGCKEGESPKEPKATKESKEEKK